MNFLRKIFGPKYIEWDEYMKRLENIEATSAKEIGY